MVDFPAVGKNCGCCRLEVKFCGFRFQDVPCGAVQKNQPRMSSSAYLLIVYLVHVVLSGRKDDEETESAGIFEDDHE